MADAGFAGPAVDEGVDSLRGEAPWRYPSRFVDWVEQGALVRASDLKPGSQGSSSASRKGAAALAPTLAGHGQVTGAGVVGSPSATVDVLASWTPLAAGVIRAGAI